jgi:hypothetical protein
LSEGALAGVLSIRSSNCRLTGGLFFAGQSWLGGVCQIDGQTFSDLPAACNRRVQFQRKYYGHSSTFFSLFWIRSFVYVLLFFSLFSARMFDEIFVQQFPEACCRKLLGSHVPQFFFLFLSCMWPHTAIMA